MLRTFTRAKVNIQEQLGREKATLNMATQEENSRTQRGRRRLMYPSLEPVDMISEEVEIEIDPAEGEPKGVRHGG